MKRLVLPFVALLFVIWWPAPASAHPLGKFSINQAIALTVSPSSVSAVVSLDFAELPTLAAKPTADLSGRTVCREFSSALTGLALSLESSSFTYEPGSAGLSTSRITCSFRAPVALRPGSVVTIANGYMPGRVGWCEITAVGSGVTLSTSLPSVSPSDGLRAYPADLLSSPVDVRTGTVRITGLTSAAPSSATPATGGPPSAPSSGGWTAGFERRLDALVGSRNLTPIAGLLAVALSLILGAAHAALPGHGKTVMAAYLAGRDGRPRDAIAVGATVTLTHTGGVLLLGLALTGFASLAGERVLGMLGIASGVLIAVVGVGLLVRALRTARSGSPADAFGHSHSHGHPHPHSHGDGHSHSHGDGHSHGHEHSHDGKRSGRDRLGMLGLGVAGGLVPSPTALLVLLGAVGFGRTAFGVALVLAYGLGMAATLTAAGLLLVRLRHSVLDRPVFARLRSALPLTTSGLILLVGLGMAVRAGAALV